MIDFPPLQKFLVTMVLLLRTFVVPCELEASFWCTFKWGEFHMWTYIKFPQAGKYDFAKIDNVLTRVNLQRRILLNCSLLTWDPLKLGKTFLLCRWDTRRELTVLIGTKKIGSVENGGAAAVIRGGRDHIAMHLPTQEKQRPLNPAFLHRLPVVEMGEQHIKCRKVPAPRPKFHLPSATVLSMTGSCDFQRYMGTTQNAQWGVNLRDI